MSIVTRTYTIAAGSSVKMSRKADFLRCLESTGIAEVQFDNAGDGGDLEGGLAYWPQGGFSQADILNPTASDITLIIAVGKGRMEDNRATVNTGQTLPTRETAPDVLSANAPVSAVNAAATLLSAANAKRREILIVNTDAAATVYIGGDPAAAAGAGVPLLPGQSLTLETSAAVYARNDSGAAVSVSANDMAWRV